MKRLIFTSSIVLFLSISTLSCVPKPLMNYSTGQLTKLEVTQELMRALYHDLSPIWEGVKKATLTPADLKLMGTTAPRVDAIATALASKNVVARYKASFADRAGDLGRAAQAMHTAATANEEPAARQALKDINKACGSCHKDYK